MVYYNKSYFTLASLIKALIVRNPKYKLENFYRTYTGKKYILITNSCRSALYLTYKALDSKGEIITSPLTCRAAIDPILASGNQPVFSDIDLNLLTMAPDKLGERITFNTKGIQLIHFGGIPCDLIEFRKIAHNNNLFIIEDCAQGLFAESKGIRAGTIGDFICFSLIKNAKGIGGGILATNDERVYKKASMIQSKFKQNPNGLLIFRILRNFVENYRNIFFINSLYHLLLKLRNTYKVEDLNIKKIDFESKLFRPSGLETRIAIIQLRLAAKLREDRQKKGNQFLKMLQNADLIENYRNLEECQPSFVKLYVYYNNINSLQHIEHLNSKKIEAMHLEYKYKKYYQERFDLCFPEQKENILTCKNYLAAHDHIVSLPFYENLKTKRMGEIIKVLRSMLNS